MDTGKPSVLTVILQLDSLLSVVFSRRTAADNGGDLYRDHIQRVLSSIIVFCNSYVLMHRSNRFALIVSMSDSIHVAYPCVKVPGASELIPRHDILPGVLASELRECVEKEIANKETTSTNGKHRTSFGSMAADGTYGTLSAALSTALSIINANKSLQSRVLILQFEKDRNQNYNAVMNSIFSAQKLRTMIDAFIVSGFDSHIMQQACFLTGGLYIKNSDWEDLLQLLHTYFLVDNHTRQLLSLPQQVGTIESISGRIFEVES